MESPSEKASASRQQIHDGIIHLVDSARIEAVRGTNVLMTVAYWEIGRRIVESERGGGARITYGAQLIKRLSKDLSLRYKRGFPVKSSCQMRLFYLFFQHVEIRQTVSGGLTPLRIPQISSAESPSAKIWQTSPIRPFPSSWSIYVRSLPAKNADACGFYEKGTLRYGWSVRQLERQITTQLYERTLPSHDKSVILQQHTPTETRIFPQQTICDPFVLEFLESKDEYSESGFEEVLINHLMDFMLELGDNFAFVGRQRRLRIDDNWFHVDLLSLHRRLRCLLTVDLRVGKFGYSDAGQMNIYFNYAKKHWTLPDRSPPTGLVLYAKRGVGGARHALVGPPNTVLANEYKM